VNKIGRASSRGTIGPLVLDRDRVASAEVRVDEEGMAGEAGDRFGDVEEAEREGVCEAGETKSWE
jgi:hypothetical protein